MADSDFIPKKHGTLILVVSVFLSSVAAYIIASFLIRYVLVDNTGKAVGEVKPRFNASRTIPGGTV